MKKCQMFQKPLLLLTLLLALLFLPAALAEEASPSVTLGDGQGRNRAAFPEL